MAEDDAASKACTGTREPIAPASLPTLPSQNPTTCGGPLTASVDDLLLRRRSRLTPKRPGRRRPAATQLSFNPSLAAQADDDRGRHRLGPRRRPQGARRPRARHALASELKATDRHPARGFSINPNAADGKTSCTRRRGRDRHRREAAMPGVLEDRHARARQLGPAGADRRAAIYLGEPKPGEPYRVFLTADGFGTHVKLPGSVHADPADGPAGGRLRRPAADAASGVQPPLLRLRARPARDPDPVRHLPGGNRIHALGRRALETRPRRSSSRLDSGPERGAVPGRARPFAPASSPAVSDNTAGVHSPLRLDADPRRRRPEPDRPRRHDAARLRGDACRGSPTARRRRSTAGQLRATRAAPSRPRRPARRRARSAPRSPAPAPAPTALHRRARSTWPAPTKARR